MSHELVDNQNFEEFQPDYSFIETREMTVKNFYNTLFVQFGLYRATQRIPRIDGLAETQRKVIWAAIKKMYKKKEKLTDVMSDISKISNYHHGPASLATVLNNLIAPYKNNIPFLKPEGSFGSRAMRSAAAERYTSTRVYDFIKVMFPEEDITRVYDFIKVMFPEEDIVATHGFRTIDGKPAEPLTLYPILPLGIINGQKQSSVGFATDLLPRDTDTILQLFKGILKGEITSLPAHLEPKWPFCDSPVKLVDENAWESYGVVKKVSKGRKKYIEISEVPHDWDGKKLVNTLEALQEAGKIEKYIDGTNGNKFYAEVYAKDLYDLTEDQIIRKLELTSKVTEKFVYIDTNDKFEINCNSIAGYINFFITERIKVYEARKAYRLAKINYELVKIIAKINYINEVNSGKIDFRNKSEEELIIILSQYPENYYFIPMTKTYVHVDPEMVKYIKPETSYDYLFDIPVRSFTPAYQAKLTEKYNKLQEEYQYCVSKTSTNLWLDDLIEFETKFNKFQKDQENAKKKKKKAAS